MKTWFLLTLVFGATSQATTINVPELTSLSFSGAYTIPNNVSNAYSNTFTKNYDITIVVTGGSGSSYIDVAFNLSGFIWTGPVGSHEMFDASAKVTLNGMSRQSKEFFYGSLYGVMDTPVEFAVRFVYGVPFNLNITTETYIFYSDIDYFQRSTQYRAGQTIHADVAYRSVWTPDDSAIVSVPVPEANTWGFTAIGLVGVIGAIRKNLRGRKVRPWGR